MGIFKFLDYWYVLWRKFLILLILTKFTDQVYFSWCLQTNLEFAEFETHAVKIEIYQIWDQMFVNSHKFGDLEVFSEYINSHNFVNIGS